MRKFLKISLYRDKADNRSLNELQVQHLEYSSMSLKHVKTVFNCCFKCNKILFYYTILTTIALPVVWDIDFNVISKNILRSVNDIPIVKPGISLY